MDTLWDLPRVLSRLREMLVKSSACMADFSWSCEKGSVGAELICVKISPTEALLARTLVIT